jgi:hypothetical protein
VNGDRDRHLGCTQIGERFTPGRLRSEGRKGEAGTAAGVSSRRCRQRRLRERLRDALLRLVALRLRVRAPLRLLEPLRLRVPPLWLPRPLALALLRLRPLALWRVPLELRPVPPPLATRALDVRWSSGSTAPWRVAAERPPCGRAPGSSSSSRREEDVRPPERLPNSSSSSQSSPRPPWLELPPRGEISRCSSGSM